MLTLLLFPPAGNLTILHSLATIQPLPGTHLLRVFRDGMEATEIPGEESAHVCRRSDPFDTIKEISHGPQNELMLHLTPWILIN